jgi:hypothetical protein
LDWWEISGAEERIGDGPGDIEVVLRHQFVGVMELVMTAECSDDGELGDPGMVVEVITKM